MSLVSTPAKIATSAFAVGAAMYFGLRKKCRSAHEVAADDVKSKNSSLDYQSMGLPRSKDSRSADPSATIANKTNHSTGAPVSSRREGMEKSRLQSETVIMQEIKLIAKKGQEIYDQIKPQLELDHFGECVCINVETGEYVTAKTFALVHRLFEQKFYDAPSWDIQIGAPPYVVRQARVL